MADPGICYCGNYGGGTHTKSARCSDSMEELRARIAQLQENNARLAEIAVELGEQRDRLTAENAELSSHLEEATQSGIDTAREITETLSKRLDEFEAENAGQAAEMSRLRERVGELELSVATERVVSLAAVQAKSAAEDRAADFEADLRHYGESEGARCASRIRKLESRERLLLEAVRWCLQRGVMAGQVWDCKSESFVDGIRACGGAFGEPIEPPPDLAPLIAEAVRP